MKNTKQISRRFSLLALTIFLLPLFFTPFRGLSQQSVIKPALEPVAETKLLMEGLANANFKGLERLLKERPTENQTWKFARGQALLIAESANLMMIRPPQGEGQPLWFDRAMKLRKAAKELAKVLSDQDYSKSRVLFVDLANHCNSCHRTFRTSVQITPFSQGLTKTESQANPRE